MSDPLANAWADDFIYDDAYGPPDLTIRQPRQAKTMGAFVNHPDHDARRLSQRESAEHQSCEAWERAAVLRAAS